MYNDKRIVNIVLKLHRFLNKKPKKYAGGGFRTRDLQIMSIAFFGRPVRFYQANWHSNQAELPRHSLCLIF